MFVTDMKTDIKTTNLLVTAVDSDYTCLFRPSVDDIRCRRTHGLFLRDK